MDEIHSDSGKPLKDTLGHFSGRSRRIQILEGQHPLQERHTLFHEWSHGVLWDTGVNNILTPDQIEAICDAFATALVASHSPIPQ